MMSESDEDHHKLRQPERFQNGAEQAKRTNAHGLQLGENGPNRPRTGTPVVRHGHFLPSRRPLDMDGRARRVTNQGSSTH